MEKEAILEVVDKLIGDITPHGEFHTDSETFANLEKLCWVVNELVVKIDSIPYENKDSHQHSVNKSVDYAEKFISKTLGISNG